MVRIPAKWAHLAPGKPGTEVRTPVSFIDLAPTLLSIVGIPVPAQMQGRPLLGHKIGDPQQYAFGMRNRMDERDDFIRTVSDGKFRYIRNYMPHRPLGQYLAYSWQLPSLQAWHREFLKGKLDEVRARFFHEKPHEELYDLTADPDQVVNLATQGGQQVRLAAMRKALDQHMVSINDNGFLFEDSPEEGYFESRQRGHYPLKKLLWVGQVAARRDPRKGKLLAGWLKDPHPVVQYWAAHGLLALGESAKPFTSELAEVLGSKRVDQVRVVAAEALVRLGQGDKAFPFLVDRLASAKSANVRLMAISALTCIGEPARPALPTIQKAKLDADHYVRNAAIYLEAVLTGTFDPAMQIFKKPEKSKEE